MIKIYIIILSSILLLSCGDDVSKNKTTLYQKLLNEDISFHFNIDSSSTKSIVNDYFINGKTLQQQGRYAEAIMEFQAALKYDSSLFILQEIAESYFTLQKFDITEEKLLEIIQIDENYLPSLELLEKIYFQKYNLNKSIIILEKIVEIKPEDDHNKMVLANLYEMQNNSKSINMYKSINNKELRISALERLSSIYFNQKSTNQYYSVLEELLELSIEKYKYFFTLYNDLNINKKYTKSINLLNKYEPFLDNSQYTNAFYNFGLSLLSDNNDSIKKYLPLFVNLSENPQYPSWYIDMISMYLFDKLTDSVNTYKYLDKFNLHGDSIPEAGLEISYFYRQKEKIEKAEDILLKYKKIYPKDLRFYQNLAGIYFFRKDFKKVAETYNEALEYDSTNANIWLEIGLAYNRLMDYEKSDFAYEKSILLEPKNALANNNFAFSLSERGIDLERAKVMVLIALEKEPKNPSYLDTYAWILYQKQDFEEALKYIKLSIENGEENSEVYEHLGDILNKLDKKIEALNAYEEGLKINPNDSALIKKVKIFK